MFQSIDSRKLIWISVSILVLMGFRWLTKLNNPYHFKDQSAGFSYEMPRVSSYGNEFDLSGREIDRQIMSDEEKIQAVQKAAEAKKTEEKKKADEKKKAETKKAEQKKAKNKSLKTNVVDTKNDGSTFEAESLSNESTATKAAYATPHKVNDKNVQQTNQQTKEDKKKKSIAEWQELLMNDPSSAQQTEFVKAKEEGLVSERDYYTVSLNMFRSTNQAASEAGLQLLQKAQSATGFELMATSYNQIDQQKREQLWRVLISYSLPNRIQFLNIALLDQNDGVVQLALQVLRYAVNKEGQSNNQGNSSVQNASVGPRSLRIFVQPLEIIVQQQTPNSELAKNILADIKSLLKM